MKLTKKTTHILLICTLLIAFAISSVQVASAETIVPAVENLNIEFISDKVNVEWDKVSSCSGYELQYTKDSSFGSGIETIVLENPSITSYSIKDTIEPDDTYFFRIRAYVKGSTKTYSEWTEPQSFAYSLSAPSLMYAYLYEDIVKAYCYGGSTYIDGYELQFSASSNFTSIQGSVVTINKSGFIEFDNDSFSPDVTYFFRCRGYKTIQGKVYYSQWSETEYDSYKMDTPYFKDIEVDGTTVNIEWSPTLAPQYILEIGKTESFADKIEMTLTNNKYTEDFILKSDTKYYVRVRADRPGIGQSSWSNVSSFTYSLEAGAINDVQIIDNSIVLNWTEKYDGCEIQLSEYSNLSVSDTFTVTKGITEYTIDKLDPGTYHFRLRYYHDVDTLFHGEQRNYSKWSPIITVQIKPDIPTLTNANILATTVEFNFTPVEKVTGYEIQISDSPTFENAKKKSTWNATADSYTAYERLVPQRKYYFRIRAFVDTKSSNCYSDWSTYLTDTLVLTKTYIKTQKVDNNTIVFDWLQIAEHDGYQIQYGYDPTLADCSVVTINKYYTTKYTIEDPKPGTCYFRIRTIHRVDGVEYYSDWSNIKSINFKINKTYLTNQYVDGNKIHVVWKNVGDAIYEIQYSRNEDFSNSSSVSVETNKNTKDKIEHTINDPDLFPGTYYIRIRVGCKSGNEVYYSDWSNAKTVNYKLSKTYIKNLKIANGQLKVDWKTLETCTGYQIQYGTDATLANSANIDIVGAEQEVHYLNLAPGTYYARIRACKTVDEQTYYSDWSNIKNITIKVSKTYLTNQYVSKDKGCIVWKSVDGVDGYEIQMSNDPDFLTMNTTVLTADAQTSKYDSIDIIPGTTYFRIRTFKNVDNNVYYSDWSNAKTLINNSVTSSIASVFSQYNKLYVQWTKNLNVDGYELQYSTDPGFEQKVQSKETLANDITQDAFAVAPGTYYIRVRTYQKTADGKTYSAWSSVTAFEFKFDSVQLNAINNGNNIDLSWTVSKGCHGYQIEYSTDAAFESDVKTLQIFNTNTLECVIQNLQSGSYNIRIRAYKNIDNVKYYSDWSIAEAIIVQ